MKFFKFLLGLTLFLLPPQTADCQVGKTIKQASKLFAKKGTKESARAAERSAARKMGKEVASATAEQAAKNSGELVAKKIIARNVSKSIVTEPADQLIKAEAKELERVGVERFLRSKLDKTLTVAGRRIVRAESKSLGQKTIKFSGGKVARELGSKESKELFEYEAKKGLKKNGSKVVSKRIAKATGEDALKLLGDAPEISTLLKNMNKHYGPMFDLNNLEVLVKDGKRLVSFKGTNSTMEIAGDVIRANGGSFTRTLNNGAKQNIGEINQFLNNLLPNKTYIVEDGLIRYYTNAVGKVRRIECESSKLYSRMLANNMYRNGSFDKNMVNKVMENYGVTNSTHDFGHLVRRELGGLNESINGLPMKPGSQRSGSAWFKLEDKEIKACKAGKNVKGIMEIDYLPDGGYTINVTKIINGKSFTHPPFTDLF